MATQPAKRRERLNLSSVNSRFSFPGGSFEEYILHSRDIILKARTDLTSENRELIVEGNSPFLLYPPENYLCGDKSTLRRGIILTHGLTDSPYSMKYLGKLFQEEGFLVEAILLPGHGTRPGDLLEVTWEEWAKALDFAVSSLKEKVEEIYLGGLSTGGALSIRHALHEGGIKGLFLFSPALKISGAARIACLFRSLGTLLPLFRWLGPLQADEDPFKYGSFPSNAACQVSLLIREIEKTLKAPWGEIPLFVAASADDVTVNPEGTLSFYQNSRAEQKKMILYTRERGDMADTISQVHSELPEEGIASSSHMAIVTPPEDPLYGSHGSIPACSHYLGKDEEAYHRCMSGKEDFLGETTNDLLSKGVVRRLTFNPFYKEMVEELRKFIRELP